MKRIISIQYPNLIRFLFSNLREEKRVPYRDNFLLVKDLTYGESKRLERFTNYVVVSRTFSTEEWDRQMIIDYIREKYKYRRKPKFDKISDDEFEHNAKVFIVSGYWPEDELGDSIYELFKVFGFKTSSMLKEFFNLMKTHHAREIMYAMLTFANKSISGDMDVSPSYRRLLESNSRKLSVNLIPSLDTYSRYDKTIEDEFRVLRFLLDIEKS